MPDKNCLIPHPALQFNRDGTTEKTEVSLPHEMKAEISIAGKVRFHIICLPGSFGELVPGRLMCEGLISSRDDILSLSVREKGDTLSASVILRPRAEQTAGHCEKIIPGAQMLFTLADRFKKGSPLHRRTSMTHSALLMHRGDVIFSCEDIRRHNVLDKAVGYAVLKDIPPEDCLIYVSGRIQEDVVEKAVTAGLGVLAGKAGATSEAVSLARESGLTMTGRTRPDSFLLYSGRIEPE